MAAIFSRQASCNFGYNCFIPAQTGPSDYPRFGFGNELLVMTHIFTLPYSAGCPQGASQKPCINSYKSDKPDWLCPSPKGFHALSRRLQPRDISYG